MPTKNIILLILFVTSFTFYYSITDDKNIQTAKVIQILDGDTLILNDSTKIRLLGINTPESSQPFSIQAKEFLENQVLNQTIQIEKIGKDKYSRTLAYIFKNSSNINELLLLNGLATLYYYETDSYYKTLKKAEKFAQTSQLGLWKQSPSSNCISLEFFKYTEPENLILKNSCNHTINLTYKDDATHIFKATIKPNQKHSQNFSHTWNDAGDTLYIYDNQGLILFHRYQ